MNDRAREILAFESVRAALANLELAAGKVTVSAGVAEHAPDESIDALVARADAALYRAKHAGRDRVED